MIWTHAMYELRRNRKIRRPNWDEDSYWELSNDGYDRIIYSDGTPAKIHLNQLKADDWEIYEEESLSNKIYMQAPGSVRLPDSILVDEVRKAIEKFKEDLSREGKKFLWCNSAICGLFKKHFGDELC